MAYHPIWGIISKVHWLDCRERRLVECVKSTDHKGALDLNEVPLRLENLDKGFSCDLTTAGAWSLRCCRYRG